VLDRLGVEPGAVRFFDDSRANVHGAEEMGIRAFLVHGVAEVRRVLEREGLS
jgi:FMN phosphatase YigB (HAD superfamily)